jgi:hypothetical protein
MTPTHVRVNPGSDGQAITCDRIFPCDGTGTAINGRIETVAPVASLVRVASGAEMDRRHHQRYGTAMDLSEDEDFGREALNFEKLGQQLHNIDSDESRLITRRRLGRRSPSCLILEIDVRMKQASVSSRDHGGGNLADHYQNRQAARATQPR